jgi:hypothetical protein
MICRTSVADDGKGIVAVWKGRDQQQEGCTNKVLQPSQPAVRTNTLTTESKKAVRKGITVADLPHAQDKVDQLREEAAKCKSHPTSLPGCPPAPGNH